MDYVATYDYWREALAGRFGAVHDGHAQYGFYRRRLGRGGPWQAVAIYPRDGGVAATVEGRPADPQEIWLWCCQHPISEETYRAVAERGEPWPEEATLPEAPPPALSNEPADPVEVLADQISAAAELAAKVVVGSQLQADQAANLRDRLNQLWDKAELERKREKRPHDEAAKAVQAKWAPMLDKAKAAAGKLRGQLTAWFNKIEAEQAREAATQAEAGEPVVLPPAYAGGLSGRRTGRRTQKVAKVTDYEAALAYVKNEPEVVEAVEKIARRLALNGHKVPGVEVKMEKVAA